MTQASELLFRPVNELASLVRDGEVTSLELVDASLERIQQLDPVLNAFVDVDAEGARAAAGQVSAGDARPLAGVPIAIKTNTPVRGLIQNMGSALLDGHRADHDAFVVRRLRDAGLVIVGMTNMPEFGILPTTEPRHAGPTRNPWDTSRTPGGSSGGSGSAVASGMVPFAHANDGGGSTRIPAACCGLVGLKPSRGRISVGPTPATASWSRTASRHSGSSDAPSTLSTATAILSGPGRRAADAAKGSAGGGAQVASPIS